MIELTEKQALALEQQKTPLEVVNPRTQEVFVLIKQEVYALTCKIVGGGKGQVWDDTADDDLIPEARMNRGDVVRVNWPYSDCLGPRFDRRSSSGRIS